jgi:FKBP12-rapamycin complex-associated protein
MPLSSFDIIPDSRLLTLWFEYGNDQSVHDMLLTEIGRVPIETWLHVIPQLIARIDTNAPLVAMLIKKQLVDIGKVCE